MTLLIAGLFVAPARDRAEPRYQSPLNRHSREPLPAVGAPSPRDEERLPGDIRRRPLP